jgi:hypothetical protein
LTRIFFFFFNLYIDIVQYNPSFSGNLWTIKNLFFFSLFKKGKTTLWNEMEGLFL